MMPKRDFTRTSALELILTAFSQSPKWSSQLSLEASPHHDILLSHNKHKISGSAYRLLQKRAYHHGTFLVNANLKNLSGLLKPEIDESSFEATLTLPSRRSPVANIQDLLPRFTVQDFYDTVAAQYISQQHASNVPTFNVPTYLLIVFRLSLLTKMSF